MRKFLSKTAGATFNQERPNLTIAVRKDCLEFIFKGSPGVYMIVNMINISDDEILLFANWGTYFNRIQNPQVQMPRLEKTCPKLFAAFFDEGNDDIKHIRLGNQKNGEMEGFSISLPGSPDKSILECVTPETVAAVEKLVDANLKFYHELYQNPPFPAWKDGLKELWN